MEHGNPQVHAAERQEKKRIREMSREIDSLLAALNAQRDREAAEAAKRRRMV